MSLIVKRYNKLLLFMVFYWLVCFFMLISETSFLYVMLAWNTLLSTMPLFFISLSMLEAKINKGIRAIVYGILWLVFFPNSVYMITDFIHISNDKMVWCETVAPYSANNGTMYSNDTMQWLKLLVIGIGVIYGLLIGMESLNILYLFLRRKISKLKSYTIIIGISLISGFAVYIGRFLRFNSWDLLMPIPLISKVFVNINTFAIEFMIVFAGFILSIFILYALFRNLMLNGND
jgi:uncharacterized membrane protein